MATLVTKFEKNEQVFLKWSDKIYCGVILSIDAHLGIFEKEWWVKYDLQTGEDTGINHIPQEHLFRTREEAEADVKWENHAVRFIGYRGL